MARVAISVNRLVTGRPVTDPVIFLDIMTESQKVWTAACALLKATLTEDIYSRWIGVIRVLEGEEGTHRLCLGVPSGFYQEWLEEHYMPRIRDALAKVGAGDWVAVLAVDSQRPVVDAGEGEATAVGEAGAKKKRKRRGQNMGAPLNSRNTFETFVVGESNNFSHAAAVAVAMKPGGAYNPLFIYGGTGLGKTHLMQAIAHDVLREGRGNVCYASSEEFTNEFIQSIQQNALAAFRRKYRAVDVLLLDDIHFIADKERTQEEFFHTFNALYESQKQIVLTSDRPASEIAHLQKRLVSRFEWGLSAEMAMADFETRVAILRSKRENMGLWVDDQAIQFIAEHIRTNIRKLEGALVRVAGYASLTRRAQVTTELLEYLLRDTIEQESRAAITMESIQRAVADHYDIRVGDMSSRQRPQGIVFPRQIAMYLCREMTDQSLPEIGRAFNRNHATVLHAVRAIGERMKTDATLRQGILALQQRLSHNT